MSWLCGLILKNPKLANFLEIFELLFVDERTLTKIENESSLDLKLKFYTFTTMISKNLEKFKKKTLENKFLI